MEPENIAAFVAGNRDVPDHPLVALAQLAVMLLRAIDYRREHGATITESFGMQERPAFEEQWLRLAVEPLANQSFPPGPKMIVSAMVRGAELDAIHERATAAGHTRWAYVRAFVANMALTAAQTAVPEHARLQMLHEIVDAIRDGSLPDWWPLDGVAPELDARGKFLDHARADLERLCEAHRWAHAELESMSRYAFAEHCAYKQRRNEQHDAYDKLHREHAAALARIAELEAPKPPREPACRGTIHVEAGGRDPRCLCGALRSVR